MTNNAQILKYSTRFLKIYIIFNNNNEKGQILAIRILESLEELDESYAILKAHLPK